MMDPNPVLPPNMAHFFDALDCLCPMHILVCRDGTICHAGPTAKKLGEVNNAEKSTFLGGAFLDHFELIKPRDVASFDELLKQAGVKLHLTMKYPPRTGLKGVLVPWIGPDHVVINLGFGISVLEAVHDYTLTSADFAPTDMTIEMLYLVEAKSAAMEASRKLNARLQGAMVAAEERAFTDTLTGLKNRRALDHVLGHLMAQGHAFSLMQLDLDFFKDVNDRLGHPAGDHVLRKVGELMIAHTRRCDTVIRAGGDEFVLIFPGIVERRVLGDLAERLIRALEKPIFFEGHECRISASIGIALADGTTSVDASQILAQADIALYASKRAGRRCHSFSEHQGDALDH